MNIKSAMILNKIDGELLDRWMQVVYDLKKVITYNRNDWKWYWYNRGVTGEEAQSEEPVGPFDTYLDCVYNIVEPYVNMSE